MGRILLNFPFLTIKNECSCTHYIQEVAYQIILEPHSKCDPLSNFKMAAAKVDSLGSVDTKRKYIVLYGSHKLAYMYLRLVQYFMFFTFMSAHRL